MQNLQTTNNFSDKIQNMVITNTIPNSNLLITNSANSHKYSAGSINSRYNSEQQIKYVQEEKPKEGNEIMVWGSNEHGQLGVGQSMDGMNFPKVRFFKNLIIFNLN